eukprot:scaffold23591_cov58-Phaeocystis_antarctica.AAC.5
MAPVLHLPLDLPYLPLGTTPNPRPDPDPHPSPSPNLKALTLVLALTPTLAQTQARARARTRTQSLSQPDPQPGTGRTGANAAESGPPLSAQEALDQRKCSLRLAGGARPAERLAHAAPSTRLSPAHYSI